MEKSQHKCTAKETRCSMVVVKQGGWIQRRVTAPFSRCWEEESHRLTAKIIPVKKLLLRRVASTEEKKTKQKKKKQPPKNHHDSYSNSTSNSYRSSVGKQQARPAEIEALTLLFGKKSLGI